MTMTDDKSFTYSCMYICMCANVHIASLDKLLQRKCKPINCYCEIHKSQAKYQKSIKLYCF